MNNEVEDTKNAYIRISCITAKPLTRGEYNEFRGWQIPADEDPSEDGYLVEYEDGYLSWCPKDKFESAAVEVPTLHQALDLRENLKAYSSQFFKLSGVRFS